MNRIAFEVDGNGEYFDVTAPNDAVAPAEENTVSMYTTSAISGGLHWKSIVDVVVSTDYGTKKVGGMTDFFVDVMLAPLVNFSDINSPNGIVHAMDAKPENIKRIGWRAGWVFRHPNKVGICYKFEFGARPGFRSEDKISFSSERSFLLLTVGLNIPAGKRHTGK